MYGYITTSYCNDMMWSGHTQNTLVSNHTQLLDTSTTQSIGRDCFLRHSITCHKGSYCLLVMRCAWRCCPSVAAAASVVCAGLRCL